MYYNLRLSGNLKDKLFYEGYPNYLKKQCIRNTLIFQIFFYCISPHPNKAQGTGNKAQGTSDREY
jgi:hypothetical protein